MVLGGVLFVIGLTVIALAPDPFGWLMTAGLLAVGGSAVAFLHALQKRLRRARARVVRALGVVLAVATGLAMATAAVLWVDYRILLFRPATAVQWQHDLDVLDQALDALPPRLRVRALAATRPQLRQFRATVAALDDQARHAALAAIVATLDDGHSAYFPLLPSSSIAPAPVQVRFFPDGLYVTHTSRRFGDLRGRRITTIGGVYPGEAYQRVARYVSADNEGSRRARAVHLLISPGLLAAAGIGNGQTLELGIESGASTGDAPATAGVVALPPVNRLKYLWWFLEMPTRPVVMRLHDRRQEHSVVAQISRIAASDAASFAGLADQILERARSIGADRVVLDVRANAGGDNTLLPGFVQRLRDSEFNHPDRLLALIGPGTFSAATNLVSLLERETQCRFVGAPTGSGPNHHGDARVLLLPNTRAAVLLSTRWHQFGASEDRRSAHDPHVWVEPSAADYFAGRDRVLEAALHVPRTRGK